VPINGTLELVSGCAKIIGIDPETGEPEYEGETEIFWDDQKTQYRGDKMIYLDAHGGEWTFDQLVPIKEESDDH
jgi:hypothetical protein